MAFTAEKDGRKYVNINLTTPEGIQATIEKRFINSNLADVAISPLLQEASKIVQSPDDHRGRCFAFLRHPRCFAFLRHPVPRVISLFNFIKFTTDRWANINIDDYAQSSEVKSNWMVRVFSSKLEGGGQISQDDA